ARLLRRDPPAEAAGQLLELVVHVLPLAQPRQRQEPALAPLAQGFRAAPPRLAVVLPEREQRHEVGALVRGLRMLRSRGAEVVGGLLAGIDDAERRREHEPLTQRVLAVRG